MKAFQAMLSIWQHRVYAIGADGYFKMVLRRSPDERPLWAWAVEWNMNYRVIGFVGEPAAMQDAFRSLPALDSRVVEKTPECTTYVREERGIEPDADRMFDPPEINEISDRV
ncbi:MAG TPA: hypothetical protein ENJ00_09735 [Phycisphaerales bacterium]|nr:hypothetical protein [Phycisphaerales bacterium]